MKKILTILLLFASLTVGATKYYVTKTGNDGAEHTGLIGDPWLTLSYSCTRVTTAGDSIVIGAGTFDETVQVVWDEEVSLIGVVGYPLTTIITSSEALNPIILGSSATQGTNGNQSISYIKMDGNDTTAYKAIAVSQRSNVKIHHCDFIDFYEYAVSFSGLGSGAGAPTTHSTGNEFTNSTITNCGRDVWVTSYYSATTALSIGGQDGMLVDGIMIDNVTGGRHSYGIKPNNEGFNENSTITNNVINIHWRHSSGSFDFSIETWNETGLEVGNNVMNGSCDLGGRWSAKVGSAGYGAWIHDNTIGPDVLGGAEASRGILLEADCWNVVVERNHIKNVAEGIYINPMTTLPEDPEVNGRDYHVYDNVRISYNLLNNIGTLTSSSRGWGINMVGDGVYTHTMNDIYLLNNVIIGDTDATSTMDGIMINGVGTITDLRVRNNIILNFDYAYFYAQLGDIEQTIDYLSIENNDAYGNGYSNVPRYGDGMIPGHNTTQNNITDDPLFISTSDFHLQTTSPAKDEGLDVGLTSDYDGYLVPFNSVVDIGAYEFGSSFVPPKILIFNGKMVKINGKIIMIEL